jgi:hypothetical protein
MEKGMKEREGRRWSGWCGDGKNGEGRIDARVQRVNTRGGKAGKEEKEREGRKGRGKTEGRTEVESMPKGEANEIYIKA